MDNYLRALSALQAIDPGTDRESWVRAGMAAKAASLTLDDFTTWSERAANCAGPADCATVWKSIRPDGGIGAGTLFAMARAAGWHEEPHRKEHPGKALGRHQAERKPPHDALALWNACEAATPAHDYIARKLGTHEGTRVYRGPLNIAGQACNGALVVPAWGIDGVLVSLQFIPPGEGKKVFLPGVQLRGAACFRLGGDIRPGLPCYITEGIGQAWSAHQASHAPAVVAFGAGRMAAVAEALHAQHPAARLVLVADAGKEDQAAAIARKVGGAWVAMPAGSPQNFDLNDMHQRDGLAAVAALLEQAKQPPQRFRLLTASDLASLPALRWLVRGVLPETGIGAFFGPSGSGKSFLALDLLGAIAEGRPWFDCRAKAAPVVYVALEGEAGIKQRADAFTERHGAIPGRMRFLLTGLDIRDATDRAELVASIKAAGWAGGVLCIDTLNRAAPGMDENDSADMGQVIDALKALQAELGGLVLAVHHAGKDSSKGLRGHSSLLAALDVVLEVTREGDRREWKLFKAKDGEDGTAHPFRLDVVEIGQDEDGEAMTSCVVAPEQTPEQAFRKALPPKAGNQRIVWDGLGELLRQAGDVPPKDAPAGIPPGRPAIRLDDAVEHLRARLICEPKRQTERTRTALQGLVARGLLVHLGGWLWCA